MFALDLFQQTSVGERVQIGWNPDLLRRLPRGGVEQLQWEAFLTRMSGVLLTGLRDRIGWLGDDSDSFSVASARLWLDSRFLFGGGPVTRWNSWIPIKLNVMLWRVCNGILPTRERLSLRGIMVDSILCPVCSVAVESIDHLFVGCSNLVELWARVAIWWGLDTPNVVSVTSLLDWADSLRIKSSQKKVFDAVIVTSLWVLWNFRNNLIFGTSPPKKTSIFDEIVDRTFFWVSNRCKKKIS